LREDNADRRLMPKGRAIGLVKDEIWNAFQSRKKAIAAGKEALKQKVAPNQETLQSFAAANLGPLKKPATLEDILRRPQVQYTQMQAEFDLPKLSPAEAEQVETDTKYEGYLNRERARAEQVRRLAAVSLAKLDFCAVPGLSSEAIERLQRNQPETLASASRLPGITPAAVTALAVFLSRHQAPDSPCS